jgi:NADH-quinone oxidoreductase subunit I
MMEKSDKTILEYRMDPHNEGFYTMQYPEEKPKIPEAFRFLPFLVTDYEGPSLEIKARNELNRCTSCGICAKACPPQCIWIVRTTDATGKPIPQPEAFYIDTDICMNCGYCAEFCPFDAIIMDHEYALADYGRDGQTNHVHDLDRLLRPASYYKEIKPTQYNLREQERIAAEEEKQRKAEEKAKQAAARKAAATAKPAAPAEKPASAKAATPAPTAGGKRSPEEIQAQREAMMARRQAKEAAKAEGSEAVAPPAEAPTPARPKRSPEEIQAQREAMMARRQAKEAGAAQPETPEPATGVAETSASSTEPEASASARPKRSPEEVQAQREAMMAKRRARDEGKSDE